MLKLEEINVCTYLMEIKVFLYFLFFSLLYTIFIIVTNSDTCNQTYGDVFIPEYTAVYMLT